MSETKSAQWLLKKKKRKTEVSGKLVYRIFKWMDLETF